jgi:amidase
MGLVNGLPVGVGVVSPVNEEARLINAMAKIERILDLGILKPNFAKD